MSAPMSPGSEEQSALLADLAQSRYLTPAGLLLVLIGFWFLIEVRTIVVIALLAVLFATIIERPVLALERRRIPRRIAVLLFDAMLVAVVLIPAVLAAPSIKGELDRFRQEEPARLRTTEQSWATSPHAILRGPGDKLLRRAIVAIAEPSPVQPQAAIKVSTRVTIGLIELLACLTIAYYYLAEKQLIRRLLFDSVIPGDRARWMRIWEQVELAIGYWLRGRLLLGLLAGIATTIVFGIMRLPYWPLLGILAGITEPVPIIGPWIGGLPAVLIAFTVSWQDALFVLAFILLRQAFVDSVLVPRITQEMLGLSSLSVFIAVLIGTELMGPAGAVLAIPLAATVEIVVADSLAGRRSGGESMLGYGWRWFSERRD